MHPIISFNVRQTHILFCATVLHCALCSSTIKSFALLVHPNLGDIVSGQLWRKAVGSREGARGHEFDPPCLMQLYSGFMARWAMWVQM